jgi:SAM-dependent methyltransferase
MTSTGWDESAEAWIASMGERGDWGREHVMDPAMLGRLEGRRFERALDVGCGEGRFCRLLRARGVPVVGIDPTERLLQEARKRHPDGDYRLARAEHLPFPDHSFDLAVSYVTLVDIADFRGAIRELARVLRSGGTLLIANLNSFISTSPDGWFRDRDGQRLHFPVDRYLEEFATWPEWAGIRIENWHRPLSAYMDALLGSGFQLRFFDEPRPASGDIARQDYYRRAPWFLVMEWQRS